MPGWNQIQEIRRLEAEIDKLGFKFASPKNRNWEENADCVSLVPKDQNSLPIYCRDAEVFIGSLTGLQYWLRGVQWARDYDRMVVDKNIEKKRERKEQDERNRLLLKTIKDSKIPERVKC